MSISGKIPRGLYGSLAALLLVLLGLGLIYLTVMERITPMLTIGVLLAVAALLVVAVKLGKG